MIRERAPAIGIFKRVRVISWIKKQLRQERMRSLWIMSESLCQDHLLRSM